VTTPGPGSRWDRADSIVVELCGLPGVGKTTLARAVVTRLAHVGSRACLGDAGFTAAVPAARRVAHKVLILGQALAEDPSGQIRSGRLLGAGQRNLRDALAVPVQWWVTEQVVAQAGRGAGVVVVEEGLVQALWTAALWRRPPDVHRLVDLAASAVRPDLVVHVDAPVELALARLRARRSQHSRVQQLTGSQQQAVMRRGDELLRHLLDEWRRQRLSEVMVLSATTSGGGDRDPLARLITRLCPHPSASTGPGPGAS
jgi:hypothetical protein